MGWEDPLEKEMATHFSILAWEMPWIGAWWITVHWTEKSQTPFSDQTTTKQLKPCLGTQGNIFMGLIFLFFFTFVNN